MNGFSINFSIGRPAWPQFWVGTGYKKYCRIVLGPFAIMVCLFDLDCFLSDMAAQIKDHGEIDVHSK